jgi:hypothetical protein
MFGLGLGIGLGQNVAALGGWWGGGFTVPSGTVVWIETDVTHMYTDAGSTLVSTPGTDTVQQINDQSGNGNHYNTATAGQRPTYQVVSGKPLIGSTAPTTA